MDNKEIARKIVNIKGYENLNEILGDQLGNELYNLVKSVLYKGGSREDGFTQGVVYACARICELYDEPLIALSVLKESGVDVAEAIEYDVAFLRVEDNNLPTGRW